MPEWIVETDELADSLAADFQAGRILNEEGQRFLTEELVAKSNGLKIEIDLPPIPWTPG